MSDVLNRSTLELLRSVNTPDYPEAQWVINPDLSPVAGVPKKYWKLVGDVLQPMSAVERAPIDASDLSLLKQAARQGIITDAQTTIDAAYSAMDIGVLSMLLTQALKQSLANRQAYIFQVMTWMRSVITYRNQSIIAVNAAADAAALAALSFSFVPPNIAADPQVTVAGALAISN